MDCDCRSASGMMESSQGATVNTLRPRQNGRHFADNIFKCSFLTENFWILNEISPKYVPYGLTDNMATLVKIMAWRRTCDNPLSESMLVYFIDKNSWYPGSPKMNVTRYPSSLRLILSVVCLEICRKWSTNQWPGNGWNSSEHDQKLIISGECNNGCTCQVWVQSPMKMCITNQRLRNWQD